MVSSGQITPSDLEHGMKILDELPERRDFLIGSFEYQGNRW